MFWATQAATLLRMTKGGFTLEPHPTSLTVLPLCSTLSIVESHLCQEVPWELCKLFICLKTSPPPPVLERVQAAMIPILECVYSNIHNHSPGITGENNMTFLEHVHVVEFPLDCA